MSELLRAGLGAWARKLVRFAGKGLRLCTEHEIDRIDSEDTLLIGSLSGSHWLYGPGKVVTVYLIVTYSVLRPNFMTSGQSDPDQRTESVRQLPYAREAHP